LDNSFPSASAHMDPNPCLYYAQRILAGKIDEDSSIHNVGESDSGKESALSVMEVLDEVRNTLLILSQFLR
jgi:hypothetical protein